MIHFKHIIVLLIVLSISLYAQNSGWLVQTSGTNSELFSIHFENGLTGWACGAGGTILTTTTGGNLWNIQPSGSGNTLRTIFFISVNNGWAAGENNTVVKTTNGGNLWSSSNNGINSSINSIWFTDANTGFAAGTDGKIYKTVNSGGLWSLQNTPVTSQLNDIMFTNTSTGWACGSTGKILKTTNGGGLWSVNIDHGSIADFYGLYFSTSVRGTAVGRYLDQNNVPFVYYYKTYTAGLWWEYQPSANQRILRDVFFVDSLTGWSVGDEGTVYATVDMGANWIDQNSRTTNGLNSVYFVDRFLGYAAGKNGTIIKTSHGGYRDTILTNRRDLGVIPLVENVQQLVNASYRVQFRTPDTSYNILKSVNSGVSFDTVFSGLNLADTGKYLDGMLIRVKKIKYIAGNPSGNYTGNVGVIKDPVIRSDSIQTRFKGWDYFPPQNNPYDSARYSISPAYREYQSRSMSISYPTRNTYLGFRSLLNPHEIRKVKIVFTGYGSGQQAYRYLSTGAVNFTYQDMKEVPFKVYEIEETDGTAQPRQLNCGFLEFPGAYQDNKWEPSTDSAGGKEVLYIFGSDYNSNPVTPYTTNNLFLQQANIDVMYVWNPRRISAMANFTQGDEFVIHPYTVTRPEIALGYPLYYEWKTESVIGIEPISALIPKSFLLQQNYPNPFNPVTSIMFDISNDADIKIKIFDLLGRELETILNSSLKAGEYETKWDGSRYSSGIYFCRLEAENYTSTIKMVLVK